MTHLANQSSPLNTRMNASDAALLLADMHISYRMVYLRLCVALDVNESQHVVGALAQAATFASLNLEKAQEALRVACNEVALDLHYAD